MDDTGDFASGSPETASFSLRGWKWPKLISSAVRALTGARPSVKNPQPSSEDSPASPREPWNPEKYPMFEWEPELGPNGEVETEVYINLRPSGYPRQYAHLLPNEFLKPPAPPK